MPHPSRRSLLKLSLAAGLLPAIPGILRPALAGPVYAPQVGEWRGFDLRTRVTLAQGGPAQVWLPVPSVQTDWQRSVGDSFTGNAAQAEIVTDPGTGARMLHARFDADTVRPTVELTSRVETRGRATDWSAAAEPQEDPAVLQAALQGTALKPLDGVVGDLAARITQGARTDRDKVAAIYAWIARTCHRDMDVAGCGSGDIRATVTTANFGGKCADLNGLFVGLARASGVPARDIYGVRVAPSDFGYKQLGANSPSVTAAQHCRAEVWLSGLGWVAMDPADVLKVMRAEADTWIKDPADPLVAPVNAALQGSWEGNWVAFNSASDLTLPGGAGGTLPFLMYPQGQVGSDRLDELDAKSFAYEMTATAV
ncbi:transglutaminase family protein [Paracoccus sp. WLY502]|uniref:transglutaminase-like domain-containing protein n=1 Tax=Paracoccus yibinensis TaxID=3068891 RepID=UPI002796D786|nr:transglutaminase family protein [Paracoccus sp. WLY502]MDQ1901533.1 transglutaminase family protein [Paracoccus sp. WLY502]